MATIIDSHKDMKSEVIESKQMHTSLRAEVEKIFYFQGP